MTNFHSFQKLPEVWTIVAELDDRTKKMV